MRTLLLIILISMVNISTVLANDVFEAAKAGSKCTNDKLNQFTCEYHIGNDLYIAIPEVGSTMAGITFFKSDWNGDYYASFALLHQCVVVKPGIKITSKKPTLGMAFISPKNGKVYDNWQDCKDIK